MLLPLIFFLCLELRVRCTSPTERRNRGQQQGSKSGQTCLLVCFLRHPLVPWEPAFSRTPLSTCACDWGRQDCHTRGSTQRNLVDVRMLFIVFFCSEAGQREEVAGGAVFIENRGRGGGFIRRGGSGAGGHRGDVWGEGGG